MPIRPTGRPPFRVDHIGSLLRPARLRQAFRRHAGGELSERGFRRIQDESIRDVVRLQQEVGLEVATDGEFRRGSYWSRFVGRTEGLDVRDAAFTFRDDRGHEQSFTAPHVVGKVRRHAPITLDEFTFLRDTAETMPKITMPSPSTMHFYRGRNYADPGTYEDAATRASISPKAAMSRSPKNSSRAPMSTIFCWSSTRRAPATSRRCAEQILAQQSI